ncbi:unnamed protein product [Vicia faba]|uniref:Uncharacterized protein n=1 Tax=Vicia faba TaxID=3906 RepID=A0AAV0Z3K1_VICFA|nr:unnamed protein product [Vicia faba]
MNKVRKGNTTLTGFAYLLMVFAFERFKCLREIFNFAIPSQFPLMLGWVNVTSENLRNRSLMPIKKACYDKLREMTDEDVDLLPYRRDGLEAELADQFKSQSWIVYAKVYTICFENIAKHPVHTCYKQLGLELGNLKKCDDFRKKMILQERGPGKDKNWRDFNLFYTHCNTRWAKRNMHLIKKNFQMFGPLVNYLQEGDVDERETESPPRCNLPTPRDEVQAPIFDSSLSHEALAIQTPQEVLYSQMSPQPTDDDFDHDHDMDDSLIYGETVEVENPNNDVDAGVGNLGVGNANNDEEVEVGNPNNDEEVGDGIPNNDVIGVEVGNNNNDVLDAGVDNHDEGEHNNNVRNYTRGEGVLRTKPRMRTMYTPEQELRVRKKTKLRKPKIK